MNYQLIAQYRYLFLVACLCVSSACLAETKPHPTAIQANHFAQALVKLSQHLIDKQAVITKQAFGGYGGTTNDLKFYRETKASSKANQEVISIVQWETKNPANLHSVEVTIYDTQGRVLRHYSATYLPVHRRAPDQTLINLHYYEDQLHSIRQFDALDNILYEQCIGSHNNKRVSFAYDFIEMPETADEIEDEDRRQAYLACFRNAATTAAPYTDPLVEISGGD